MKLHDLRPNKGATKKRKRVGRGIAAGQGKTAGRGTKGTGARTGGGKGPYFEGGQLPLVRRLPFKRGFNNIFRIEYQEINLDQLEERFKKGDAVNGETLVSVGLIKDASKPWVILGRGELKKALKVQTYRLTKNARAQIEAAGGSIEILEMEFTGAHATVKLLTQEQINALRTKKAG
jgi:large subunit ribosomal protein L15